MEGHYPDEFLDSPAERGSLFFRRLISLCEQWGVIIKNFRIISVEAKHLRVSESLELTAVAKLRAQAQATAATSEAQTIETLANANKKAQQIRAEASRQAADILREDPIAFELNTQENNIRAASEFGTGKNNLVFGMRPDTMNFVGNSAAFFACMDPSQQKPSGAAPQAVKTP